MKGFSSLGVVGVCALVIGCDSPPSPTRTFAPALAPAATARHSAAPRLDSIATHLAEKVLAAAGGREKFKACNYFSFHFVIESDTGVVADWRHDWDRRNNRYRLEGELPTGEHVLMWMHLNNRTGRAFQNGQPVPVEEAKPLMGLAYSRFLSDFYWLLLPFKLHDPGVRLEYQGRQEIGQVSFETVRLSFADKTGLTPENSYRLFIDPATFRIQRWEFFATPQSTPLVAWWENWQDFNGIALAMERRLEGTSRRILFEELVVSAVVDESLFAVPAQLSARVY
ncbi:MAG: DUF6503 family protein [bacterium]